jgi:hypothetical protein
MIREMPNAGIFLKIFESVGLRNSSLLCNGLTESMQLFDPHRDPCRQFQLIESEVLNMPNINIPQCLTFVSGLTKQNKIWNNLRRL